MVVALACLLGIAATSSALYLLALLLAACLPGHSTTGEPGATPLVVVPAHDEEGVIAATIASLRAQDAPPVAIVVIADNCTDETARVAQEAGAQVLVRTEPERRGKGWALAWGFERLLAAPEWSDIAAFAVIDADTQVAPGFCRAMAARLAALAPGEKAAFQGRYGVLNIGDGWRAALMGAAFDLVNHVRLLGADRLRSFVGLKGNGMVFTRALLKAHPWSGESVTEDLDYALDLDRAGIRVRYAPEARVAAQMPVDSAPAATQRSRWESGRTRLVLARTFSAMRFGRLGAALDLLTPPLGELCALLLLWGLLTPFCPLWTALWWAGTALGLSAYVLGGLLLSRTPAVAWRALLLAPFYVAWKLTLRLARPTREWVRTERIRTGGGSS